MKNIWFFFILLVTNLTAQSYDFIITGHIESEKEKSPIEAATIHLEKIKDSTVAFYTISDKKGNFTLEGRSYDNQLKLVVSFIGMNSFSKKILLEKSSTITLDTIALKEKTDILDEVVITSVAPITIKKDTLEFNVSSFKTRKNAKVEDLLKKLPGIEVDNEGKITVNGKPVNKVLVNGKPFFGKDHTIATKNLSKDIIEKVQVTDTKSKSQAFTGEQVDGNQKTINLTIKKENSKGWFGDVAANGGTNDRYEASSIVNRFNDATRISLLAGIDNTNSFGYGANDTRINRISFRNGITTTQHTGINYIDEFSKGFETNSDYFYSNHNTVNSSKNSRAYSVLTEDNETLVYYTNASSESNEQTASHSFDTNFDIEIDSTLLIRVNPEFEFTKTNSTSNTNESSLDSLFNLTNQYSSNIYTSSKKQNFNNRIVITKKIGSKGGFLRAQINNKIQNSESDEFNNSMIEIFGDNSSLETQDQRSTINNRSSRIQSRLKYRHPLLKKRLFLDFQYKYQNNENNYLEGTYDFETSTNDYTLFNSDLSSDFTYKDITKTPSIALKLITKKFNFNIQAGQVFRTLKNVDQLRPEQSLSKDFKNLLVNASLRYKLKLSSNLNIRYRLEYDPPNLKQIQPFTDISNPSNSITGNPDLSPTEQHTVNFNFNTNNLQKKSGLYAYAFLYWTNNNIVSNTFIDTDLTQATTYENVDGTYRFTGGIRTWKKHQIAQKTTLNIKAGTSFSNAKSISILNSVENSVITSSFTPNISFDLRWNDFLVFEPSYRITFSKTDQNQTFSRHLFTSNAQLNFSKKWEWHHNLQYTYNPDLVGFNASSLFWNSSLSYTPIDDKIIISLKAFDILNQNTNAQRSATLNYIEDAESNVLQQYFLIGLTWKFNTTGKKKSHNFGFRF